MGRCGHGYHARVGVVTDITLWVGVVTDITLCVDVVTDITLAVDVVTYITLEAPPKSASVTISQ